MNYYGTTDSTIFTVQQQSYDVNRFAYQMLQQASMATTANPWPVWVTDACSTNSSTIWHSWIIDGRGAQRAQYGNYVQPVPEPRIQVRDPEPVARARKLLVENLTEEQRAEFEEKKQFHVRSRSGKLYRVTHGVAGNIYRVENVTESPKWGERRRFCIHPTDHEVPAEDVMLAQKLWLEGNEEEFLRVANAS